MATKMDELIKSNAEFDRPKSCLYFFFCEFEICKSFCLISMKNTMTEFEKYR